MEVTETRINKQSRLIADTNKHERSKLYKKTNRLTADYEYNSMKITNAKGIKGYQMMRQKERIRRIDK